MANLFGRSLALFLLLVSMFTLQSCEETVNPQGGTGKDLSATVGGTNVEFPISTAETEYDDVLLTGRFTGATSQLPVKTLALRFSQFDIKSGTYPTTLSQGDVLITYIDESGNYQSSTDPALNDCVITLTNYDDDILDGTFRGTLYNQNDTAATKTIQITNGTFSVEME